MYLDEFIPEQSLSSRRAWIEMGNVSFGLGQVCVALLTESVDRNHMDMTENAILLCRSPHGERG